MRSPQNTPTKDWDISCWGKGCRTATEVSFKESFGSYESIISFRLQRCQSIAVLECGSRRHPGESAIKIVCQSSEWASSHPTAGQKRTANTSSRRFNEVPHWISQRTARHRLWALQIRQYLLGHRTSHQDPTRGQWLLPNLPAMGITQEPPPITETWSSPTFGFRNAADLWNHYAADLAGNEWQVARQNEYWRESSYVGRFEKLPSRRLRPARATIEIRERDTFHANSVRLDRTAIRE